MSDADEGATTTTTDTATTETGASAATASGPGFPADTPIAEMSPAQQAAYWKHQSRQHEAAKKRQAEELAALRPKAEQYEQLAEASKTEAERAIDAARAETRAQVVAEMGAAMVDAQFTAATAGRLTDEQRDALLDGLDRSRFLADGGVDLERVREFVDRIAPAATTAPRAYDLGQGRRDGQPAAGVAAGAEIARQRFGIK